MGVLSWLQGTSGADGAKGVQKFFADMSTRLFRALGVADAHVALSNLKKRT